MDVLCSRVRPLNKFHIFDTVCSDCNSPEYTDQPYNYMNLNQDEALGFYHVLNCHSPQQKETMNQNDAENQLTSCHLSDDQSKNPDNPNISREFQFQRKGFGSLMRIKYLKLRSMAHLLSLECVHCS